MTTDSVEPLLSFNEASLLWITISTVLILLMQVGFATLEMGLVRKKNVEGIALKNLLDWIVVTFVFSLLGFGLMCGESYSGWLGTSFFLVYVTGDPTQYLDVIFQTAFAATSLTIVSGSLAGRTNVIGYIVASVLMGSITYPIFAHWVWGDIILSDNMPWLQNLGFIDFAGSTVVHSLGAWTALVGCLLTGPRIGRYREDGSINQEDFQPASYGSSVIGVIVLWIGWFGFNGGTWGKVDGTLFQILINTNLAAASAGLFGCLHALIFQKGEFFYEKLLGSTLGGLVAITAGCHLFYPMQAVLVGLLAALVHNYSYDLIIKTFKIDDVVGAIPVHGFCGVLGTLLVPLGTAYLPNPSLDWQNQLCIQILGIVSCLVWSAGMAFIVFQTLRLTTGLRVSPKIEREGINIVEELKNYSR